MAENIDLRVRLDEAHSRALGARTAHEILVTRLEGLSGAAGELAKLRKNRWRPTRSLSS